MFTWGCGANGVIGNSQAGNISYTFPQKLDFFSDKNIVEVVAGSNFNFARSSSHQWYSWYDVMKHLLRFVCLYLTLGEQGQVEC